ncbi:MAG TPA: DUF3617 family protein [Sphingomicrobium sp.]|nr:DUF3617 family protein [Sphingomicrobium sp.]
MNGINRLALACGGLGAICLLAAASPPAAFAGAEGGLWEISRSGGQAAKLCVADPVVLAQFEHRNEKCTRDVVRDSGSNTTINYTCSGGGFGHSSVKMVTPRSLRVETQGISGGAPFKYVFQARRVGNCPGH